MDKQAIDEAYAELIGQMADLDRETLFKTAAKMAVLVKELECIEAKIDEIVRFPGWQNTTAGE